MHPVSPPSQLNANQVDSYTIDLNGLNELEIEHVNIERTTKWYSPEVLIHFLGRTRANAIDHEPQFHPQTHIENQIL